MKLIGNRSLVGLKLSLAVALVASTAAITSCSTTAPIAATPSASATPINSIPGAQVFDGIAVSGSFGVAPVTQLSDTIDASKFLGYDLILGSGASVTAKDKVSVEYLARSVKSKREFDSSWGRGKPFVFLPSRVNFSAFSRGVLGMKVGGRRVLVIPGAEAFGATPPAGSGLGVNESLVFVVDLLKIG